MTVVVKVINRFNLTAPHLFRVMLFRLAFVVALGSPRGKFKMNKQLNLCCHVSEIHRPRVTISFVNYALIELNISLKVSFRRP